MAQAQSFDAGNSSDLQNNKPVTAKRMKRMGDLSRAQRLTGTPIYEAEFLAFSYGFRPKRSQHQALDALAFGIGQRRINWVLDCDVQSFSTRSAGNG